MPGKPIGKPIQRDGDINSGGGIILPGQGHTNVLINGTPAARPFSLVTPHIGCPKKKLHCIATTLPFPGSQTVFANGEPLILTGNKDTCLHGRIMGSPNVLAV